MKDKNELNKLNKLNNKKYGVYVGRFCPLHINHEKIIRELIKDFGYDGSLVVIGSSNAPLTKRNIFTYSDRKGFIKKLFPDVRVTGMPDFGNVPRWLEAFDDMLNLAGMTPDNTLYYGGSKEDLDYFIHDRRDVLIFDRMSGDKGGLSATKVREYLKCGEEREITKTINPMLIKEVKDIFKIRRRELIETEAK